MHTEFETLSLQLYSFRATSKAVGGSEHQKFCECFEILVADETAAPWQQDVLNILEPWRKVVTIDEDELVILKT